MVLSVGMDNDPDEVTQVQALLRSLGFTVPITGVYDTATQQAVLAWQSRLGVVGTGNWDSTTHAATLNRMAQPGGPGGPVIVPPRASPGLDLDRWGATRAFTEYTPGTPVSSTLDGFAFLQSTLEYYNLGALTPWALDLLQRGTSEAEILLLLEQQPEFLARFPYNEARRAKGYRALSPEEMLQYEEQTRQIMRQAGFPAGFYDGPEDFLALMESDVSPMELQDRVNDGYRRVAEAHPSVREAFRDYFGIEGDMALAMLYIDPNRSQDDLIRMANEAQVAASARRLDFSMSRPLIEEMVRVGINEQDSSQIFGRLNEIRGVFDEQLGETEDLTAEGAVRSQVGLAGGQANEIERRATRRVLRGSGVGGGAELEAGLQLGAANE